ncbi:MAG: T9SS C-terminal target domain-containing protein [Sphingobacteriales bacterium]|nr:MAG: T9SS C-terminal target domain-containing protein [Sphingobacteriales bacterium]TAF80500.1 MAG: T9SS C-terminal target domain-containing protein [Sphingobacteriales bacterium]
MDKNFTLLNLLKINICNFKNNFLYLILYAVIAFCPLFTFSQSIFSNPITGTNPSYTNPYTAGQVVDANLSVSGIGYGSGLTATAGNDRYNLKSWPTGALSANAYIEFVLTPNSTFKINFTSLVYTGSSSANAPANLVLRSSVDNFTTDISVVSPLGATIGLSAAVFQNITNAITFRIYGYNAIAATGTFSINNFTFNGTVVPTNPILPVISSPLTVSNVINIPSVPYQITASNFPSSFNATGLPPGLSINTSTGRITGTPTSLAGSPYSVTISAINAAGTSSTTLVYTVSPQSCAVTGNITWSFDAPSASPSSNTTSNLTISDITRVNNRSSLTMLEKSSISSGYLGVSGNYNAGVGVFDDVLNTSTSTYFEFTLTPAANYTSTLTAIEFGTRSSGSGPVNYSIRSSLNSYASDIATEAISNNSTWTLRTPSLSPTQSGTGTAVTYRIYGYGGAGATAGAVKQWRIDDVKLTVDVTRTPPTVYAITNNGTSYCAGGVGIAVGLSGSQTGVDYQLILNSNTTIGPIVAGTGSAISFGNQTSAGTYTVNAVYNGTTCVSDMSNPFNLSINSVNTWTGTTSTAWEDATNWACGVVPNAGTAQINIGTAANQPVLNSNILISGILNLQTGATLHINGQTLTLNSIIMGNGSLIGSATSNLVVDNETGAGFSLNFNQNNASNRTLNNYTQNRNATVTLSNPLWIKGVLNITSNTGVLGSGAGTGNLTLLASAGNVSSISYLNAGADVSGNVNVQTYFTGGPQLSKRGTRMIAFPVKDNQAQPKYIFEQIKSQMFFTGPGNTSNNFDLGGNTRPNAVSMVTQDEFKPQGTYAFTVIPNLITRTIPATAYFFFYRGDRVNNVFNKLNEPFADPENVTVTYNGPINKGNIDIAVTHTPNIGDNYNGICAIGNPYPSIIDFDAFLTDNSARIEDIISIIKPDRTGQITKVGNVSTNNNFNEPLGSVFNTPNTGIRYVQPCQSFYVKVKPGQSGLVSFNELHKASNITTPARLLSSPTKPIRKNILNAKSEFTAEAQKVLILAINNQTINNETAIIFKDGYQTAYESVDAPLLSNPILNCATLSSDGVALAINLMPNVNKVNSVKLLIDAETSQTNLSLNFKGLSNFTNQNMVLKDKYLNISQPLDNATNNYVFGIDKSVAASFGSERFELQISPKATLALHITKFEVTAKNNTALLKWEVSSNKEIQKFEIQKSEDGLRFIKTGETFINTDTQNNSYTFVDNYPYPTTYYKIKQINTTGSDYSEIKVLNNNIKNPNDYQIYPTSVTDKLNINCKNNIPTNLSIQIISLNGNIIQTYKAQQASNLQVPMQQIKPGMYIVKISNPKSKENLYISKITKQ